MKDRQALPECLFQSLNILYIDGQYDGCVYYIMIRDFLKLFLRFVKTNATPKMFSRFLMIGVREFTDRQLEEEKRRRAEKFKHPDTIFGMVVSYLQAAGQQDLAQDVKEGVEYSEVHSLHIMHDHSDLTDIETERDEALDGLVEYPAIGDDNDRIKYLLIGIIVQT